MYNILTTNRKDNLKMRIFYALHNDSQLDTARGALKRVQATVIYPDDDYNPYEGLGFCYEEGCDPTLDPDAYMH